MRQASCQIDKAEGQDYLWACAWQACALFSAVPSCSELQSVSSVHPDPSLQCSHCLSLHLSTTVSNTDRNAVGSHDSFCEPLSEALSSFTRKRLWTACCLDSCTSIYQGVLVLNKTGIDILLAARGMPSLTVRGVLRKSSQEEEQPSAPGVAAYLLARGEVAVAVEALISQGALGDCTEGLPASCAFEGLVNKGLGWPCASVPCTHRQPVECGKQGSAYVLKAWPASCD